jgi:esterase/lipase superfamily enzyme
VTKRKFLTFALIAVVALGGWFYSFYFKSTTAAIRHAEAFLFRRMTVMQLDEQGEYRHFFVTNRRPAAGSSGDALAFGSQKDSALSFGTFDVSIEPSLGLGMIINPTDWFQNEEISLASIRQQEREAFVQSLRSYVESSPKRSLLIVIHGFRERFESALRKTAFVASVLDIDTPVLVFDWPGDQGSSLRGYNAARQVATESGAALAELLELIVRDVQPDKLSLIANSMGGQVVVDAFSILFEDPEFGDPDPELDHIFLTAPDVDHAEFNARFRQEIRAMAEDLTVYVSSNDRALLMSRVINRGLRAGESTLSPDQLEEAAAIAGLVEPDSDLVTLVDVTPVNRTRNFHNFSLETPEFFDDLFLRLTLDESTPPNRLIYRVATADGTVYWVLTRGR